MNRLKGKKMDYKIINTWDLLLGGSRMRFVENNVVVRIVSSRWEQRSETH